MLRNSERDWLVPSAVMTIGLGLAAWFLMPIAGYDRPPEYFERFLVWMAYMAIGSVFILIFKLRSLRLGGIADPGRHLFEQLRLQRGRNLAVLAGLTLAGMDLFFFMWIKPELTAISPFWADKLFADMDRAIFGFDVWRAWNGTDLEWHAWAYSFLWMIALMATVVWLFLREGSRQRSTAVVSYFAIWSLFGPIGQLLFSSAGPIFYGRLGLGNRFDAMAANIPDVTNKVAGYLWDFHTQGELGVGAGISAMPSLHVATVTWIWLTFRSFNSWIAPFSLLFGLYIFAMSTALGWHYAVDGFVGALGAVVCHYFSRQWLISTHGRKAKAGEPSTAIA